jgi:hypothetical protein
MSTIEFSDGMKLDVSGPYRVERRPDGYYVLGNGVLLPVDDPLDGYRLINRLTDREEPS